MVTNNKLHKKTRYSTLDQFEMNIENEKLEFLKEKIIFKDTKQREEERLETIKKAYLKEQFEKEMTKCYIKKVNDESKDISNNDLNI